MELTDHENDINENKYLTEEEKKILKIIKKPAYR